MTEYDIYEPEYARAVKGNWTLRHRMESMTEQPEEIALTRWCITHGKPMTPAGEICSSEWVRRKRHEHWTVVPECEWEWRTPRWTK